MKKRNRIFTAFLAATLIIAPSALAFADAAPDGSTDAAKETAGGSDVYGVERFSPGKGKPSF